ncbi:exonuclease domain-containing protein [Chryseobacterium jejuense]|uniref:Exonuclease n=1 Tax=Chryseobacterium jejuense TaxID=445960 RepID=A0A2X2WZA9_CHRJE|nr:exonuclease domain-containing protein [Chryseobacterium jejuense]SDJ57291.1 Exonuclease [Chryseobacterium jejuense]SQB46156.1 exonuclease [Chryseobacterium jejuense]
MKFSSDLVIYDLEGSCKTFGKNEISETNIIEIGAVKLDKKTFEIKSEFSILIKPKHSVNRFFRTIEDVFYFL